MNKRIMPFTSELQVRAAENENEAILEGYFVVYDSETELWRGAFEEVAPGAFEESLRTKNILCLDNHDSRIVLGSTDSGTLELRSDSKGLWGRVTIDLEDPNAKSAYRKVQTGKVKGCSFGFYPTREEVIEKQDGSVKWRVLEAELLEVSTTAFPAYPQTDVSARQRDAESIKKEKVAKTKQRLREMLKNDN
ncbi:HK97 family phage prohead protease [Brevibacillus choshinensis]|uniref:HK97 family phage prohead protease n=1 Tax=Brevibacillus choshinensis TaxID=54911 RepID=A0ABX7FNQ4_BRECH|nr:HK97 family phage prohead protease [Brevibacillus choshinensis]QRG66937.1 HK97 family phage prohead protease [Brevibacillus choshinensis]